MSSSITPPAEIPGPQIRGSVLPTVDRLSQSLNLVGTQPIVSPIASLPPTMTSLIGPGVQPSDSDRSGQGGQLNTGAIIGIVLGAAGVLLAAVIIAFWCFRRKSSKRAAASSLSVERAQRAWDVTPYRKYPVDFQATTGPPSCSSAPPRCASAPPGCASALPPSYRSDLSMAMGATPEKRFE